MADRHRRQPTLGLHRLAGIVDDERVDHRHGAQHRLRPARRRQSQRLARQPFERAVRAEMDQRVDLLLASAQPGVDGDVVRRAAPRPKVSVVSAEPRSGCSRTSSPCRSANEAASDRARARCRPAANPRRRRRSLRRASAARFRACSRSCRGRRRSRCVRRAAGVVGEHDARVFRSGRGLLRPSRAHAAAKSGDVVDPIRLGLVANAGEFQPRIDQRLGLEGDQRRRSADRPSSSGSTTFIDQGRARRQAATGARRLRARCPAGRPAGPASVGARALMCVLSRRRERGGVEDHGGQPILSIELCEFRASIALIA